MNKEIGVRFWNYGQYSSSNYGTHTLAFEDAAGNEFYFSYETLIAFKPKNCGMYVSENLWGNTTGKHLNWIDGGTKKARLSRDEFNQKYKEIFKQ